MNFRIVFHFLGLLLIGLAGMMVLLTGTAFSFGEEAQAGRFGASALVTGFVAGALILALRGGQDEQSGRREMFMMLACGWFIVPLFAGLPFLNASLGLSVFEAWFEGASALTTTGISLIDPETRDVPLTIFLWRGLLAWVGGFCAVIMMIVFLASSGLGGLDPAQVSFAHGEGEGVLSRSRQTIKLLGPIYAGVTLAGWAGLNLSGMSGIDSLLLAMAAVSTSGIAGEGGVTLLAGNWTAMLVMSVLCLLGMINMTHHARLLSWRRRSMGGIYFGDPELGAVLAWIMGGTLILAAGFMIFGQGALISALAAGLFNMVSFASTTGFGLIPGDVDQGVAGLPLVSGITLGIAMVIGGSVASTAGGVRPMRLIILFKQGTRELARMVHARAIVRFRIGHKHIDTAVVRAISALLLLYIVCGLACALGLAALGLPAEDAVIAALSAMTNCGPALEFLTNGRVAGPDLQDGTQVFYALGMILGRVEVLAFLALLTPQYWRR